MTSTSKPPALLRIAGSGAVCAVGTRAWQSAASWVGGARRNRRTTHPAIGELPITIAGCPELTGHTQGIERLAALLAAALADLFATTPVACCARPAYTVIAMPEGMDGADATALWQQTLQRLQPYGHAERLAGTQYGHTAAGSIGGFEAAQYIFERAEADAPVLLAGVDSLLDPERLRADYAARKLHTDDNTEGWIAGEAAGCILLAAASDTRSDSDRELVMHCPAIASATRPHFDPEQEPDPDALAEALRKALAHACWQGQHVGRLLCDSDGSAWRASANAQARQRAGEGLAAPQWEPATVTGYIGAATAPVHWALAAQRLRHDRRPPNSILSSVLDPGHTAAAVALERTLKRTVRRTHGR